MAYRMVWAYLKGARPSPPPFIVHRLDHETSGLLVIAKTPETKQYLGAVLLGHRGAAVRRDRGGRGDDGAEGTLRDVSWRSARSASGPPTPTPAEERRRARRDHPVPRGRAASGRDPVALGSGPATATRSPGSRWRSSATPVVGDVRHGARRGLLCLHATRLASAIPAPGCRSSSTARPPPRSGGRQITHADSGPPAGA